MINLNPMTRELVQRDIEAILSEPFFCSESDEMKDTFRVILASCFLMTTNADEIAKFLRLSRDHFVRPRARRLRDNGIWQDDRVNLDLDGKTALGLLLAGLIAEGHVEAAVELA